MRQSANLVLALLCLASLAFGSENYSAAARHFDYDPAAPLNIVEIGVESRDGVQVHDLTYAGGKGAVPAYLVVPESKGPFAAILWGHWMMEGSPYRNRREFLEEAIILAKSGVVSLLIDAPMVRPDHQKQDEPLEVRDDVVDLRRGLDLLASRGDIDAARIAYVGHSFHAAAGAILAGVDKRPKAFVLMAGALDYSQYLVSTAPVFVDLRKRMSVEDMQNSFRQYSWSNPCQFAANATPAKVFLQNGNRDDYMTLVDIEHYNDCVSSPKETEVYSAGHALNPAATKDRDRWLQKQLGFDPVDVLAIGKLPQLK